MRTMTQPAVFAQIHSEMQNQNPSATSGVFTQIHQENGGSAIACVTLDVTRNYLIPSRC